ncbi:hypothetical protein N0V90_012490 [Kalmusia sp. IMI 367209]|nr:hypothetical protein N0V90_012490 [Kalmusia sp. IMI 367209]
MSTAASLDNIPPNTNSRPTELSVFIHCIKLRQISSHIHTSFYTGHGLDAQFSGYTPQRHVYTSFSRFFAELKAWRLAAPSFQAPRSLYERPEWHEFLYQKDLMLLARGALHNIPSHLLTATGILREIFMACYGSARRVIELYANLMDDRAITWTRSYFQVIFTAGLTVIYCLNFDTVRNGTHELEPVQTLNFCQRILTFFKEKMPDAGSFALAFELLKGECVKPRPIPDNGFRHMETTVSSETTTHNHMTLNSSVNDMEFAPLASPEIMGDLHLNAYTDPGPFDINTIDPSLGFTDDLDLMTQLEAGLGEYAWGWLPMDNDFLGPMPFH